MRITFCVVALNEEKTVGRLLENLLEQTYSHKDIEVILVDGQSADRTKEIFLDFQASHTGEFDRVLVLDNPGRTLPCGWNVVLANYTGDAVVRLDAHAEIPADFLEKNVAHLESGEYVCGGYRPNIIDEDTPWKSTLLAAESSVFGSSIADFRRNGTDRQVDSVFHGAYRREVFDRVGLYNESLRRTEDNDMHYRIRRAGFAIWFHPDIISYQHTRNTLRSMLRQKYQNGYWIARTLFVTPGSISWFYLVPALFVLGILFTGVLAGLGVWQLGALLWGLYALFAVVTAGIALIADPGRNILYLLLPLLFLLIHLSYGAGTLVGLCASIPKTAEE